MIQQIIKAIDANKSIPKVDVLDVTKMLTVCWEDATGEKVKKCFAKSLISPKDQANAQNATDDPFIELRNNMRKIGISWHWLNSWKAYSWRICKFRWYRFCHGTYFTWWVRPCKGVWSRGPSLSRKWWRGWRWYNTS